MPSANINGLNMYYERSGAGHPLLLIHGGGSTIDTSFGRIIPLLTEEFQIIAVETQAHGRTPDIDRPESFTQDADDIAQLLDHLNIPQASIFGFSNGATTALQLGIRHPKKVNRLVLLSALYKRGGAYDWLWQAMEHASIDNMPQALKDAYLAVNPDPRGLPAMHDKDAQRMRDFEDIEEEKIKSITAPAQIIVSDQDVITPEHAVELFRLLPKAELLILPGVHGECIGEIASYKDGDTLHETCLALIKKFLQKPSQSAS